MTRPSTTLAQLSDLHLPFPNWPPVRHWNIKRALGFLNWHRGRRYVHRFQAVDAIVADMKQQAPDHIAVTGDLVNLGLPQEYHAALAWLDALGTAQDVSVIPGNHDIYCRLDKAEHCQTIWSPYMQSDALGRDLGAGDPAMFPFVRQIGSVALVSVNSAMPTPPFVAQGRVGPSQCDALRTLLHQIADKGLFACVMVHHPPLPGQAPQSRALVDADTVSKLLSEAPVGLVLYGHNHRDAVTWLDRRDRPGESVAVCGAASASASRRHKTEPLAQYYLYEFVGTGDDIQVTRIARGLNATKTAVVELDRVTVVPGP